MPIDGFSDTIYYNRTANLPAVSSFTACGWGRWTSLLAADFPVAFLLLGTDSVYIAPNANNTLAVWVVNTASTGISASTGTWYFWAITHDGVTGRIFLGAATDASLSTQSTATSAAGAGTSMRIGNSGGAGEFMRGALAGVKVWGAALTQAELDRERWSYLPRRHTNLNAWYPLFSVAEDEVDFGIDKRTLTVNGVPATSAQFPPIGWGLGEGAVIVPSGAPPSYFPPFPTPQRIIVQY